jgi:hypothetical protein
MPVLNSNEIFFTAFEPKVQNRWLMTIQGVPAYLVHKVKFPTVDLNEIVLDHINVYRKIKGKARWSNMDLTLWDPVTPSGEQVTMEWIRLSHESVTGRDGYSDFYKKDITLSELGPVGDVVGEWIIKGAFIKTADFGQGDYSAGEATKDIQLTLAMDYCILNY